MITITNGTTSLLVSRGSFDSIYKPTGWVITGSDSEKTEEVVTDEQVETNEPESEENTDILAQEAKEILLNIPVENMTGPQLKEAAKVLGISTKDKSKEVVRKEVEEAMANSGV